MGVGLGRAPAPERERRAGEVQRRRETGGDAVRGTRARRSSLLRLIRRSAPSVEIREGERGIATLGRDATFRRALIGADLAAAALTLALVTYAGGDTLLPAAVTVLPLIVVAAKTAGLYDRDEHLLAKSTLDEATSLFHVATVFTLLAWLSAPLVLDGRLGRVQALALWAGLFLTMALARALARRLSLSFTAPERCLVLGDARSARDLVRRLERSTLVNAAVIGRVPLEERRNRPRQAAGAHAPAGTPPVLGDLPGLAAVLWRHGIERVVIAPRGDIGSDRMLDKIRLIKAVGVKVTLLPRLLEVVGSSVEFDEVDGMPLLGVRVSRLSRSSRRLKRALDLAGSLGGIVVLAPLFALAALAIKLDSRGPVLFRQRRVGANGREFQLVKLRTMREDAEQRKSELEALNEAGEGLFKIADDPRITRAGRVLRRLNLDELPQLWNVLRGEMSLVGPRPLVPEEDERIEGWLRRRLESKPGMTGAWQVLGSSRVPLRDMVRLDYLYRANWSLWLDLKILLRTVPMVFGRRGL